EIVDETSCWFVLKFAGWRQAQTVSEIREGKICRAARLQIPAAQIEHAVRLALHAASCRVEKSRFVLRDDDGLRCDARSIIGLDFQAHLSRPLHEDFRARRYAIDCRFERAFEPRPLRF